VLVKTFLSNSIEFESGDRAFEAWRGKAPHAMRAAPAGYGFIFGPDHASLIHTSAIHLIYFAIRHPFRSAAGTESELEDGHCSSELLPIIFQSCIDRQRLQSD
jgi:hypothetical protein